MSLCKIITNLDIVLDIVQTNHEVSKNFIYKNSFEMLEGWQKISITASQKIKIKDILIDNFSIGENIYTAWLSNKDGNIKYPGTILEEKMVWNIILHNNLGFYKAHICSQIMNGDYGKIYSQYFVTTDIGKKLKNHYNPEINSFFEFSQGINFFNKNNFKNLPFVNLNLNYDSDLLFDDIKDADLKLHSNPKHSKWFLNSDYRLGKIFNSEELPFKNIVNLLLKHEIKEISSLKISVIEPKGFINLHIDNHADDEKFGFGLHLPIYPSKDTPLKLHRAGIMPKGANLINNETYSHCVVNELEIPRYVLLIASPIFSDDNFIEKYGNLDSLKFI